MIDKRVPDFAAAVEGIADGATVLIGGFGSAGLPHALCDALLEQGAQELVVVSNNAGSESYGLGALIGARRIRKVICSYPRVPGYTVFDEVYKAGEIELEIVPQGTLAERIRAGGAGIKGFYTRTSVGTPLAEGKELREFDGQQCVFEYPIRGDVAFIQARSADRWGNLLYDKTARNFGPVMALAADLTVAEVAEFVDVVDPEQVVTPGIFVDRVVELRA